MSYSEAKVVQTIGGEDQQHNDDYLFSQSQHILADDNAVFVTMMLNYNIRAVNNDGSFKQDIGEMGFGDEEFQMASGMCLYGDNQMIVTDNNGSKVQIRRRDDGSFVKLIDGSFDAPVCCAASDSVVYIGQVGDGKKVVCLKIADNFSECCSISSTPDDDLTGANYLALDAKNRQLVVSDTDLGAVHVFDAETCAWKFRVGASGSEPGQFDCPSGVAVNSDGNILVCDMAESKVHVFNSQGEFVEMVGGSSTELFSSPMDVFVRKQQVLVVDGSIFAGCSRVQVLEK